MEYRPIGVFDSGFGGLTVLKEIEQALPQYDYLYLGDNARAPYGNRSFETVYAYTLEAVQWLFSQGCHLVILGCTHYTLLQPKISRYISKDITLISQGIIVAKSLKDYLIRHPEMEERCSQQGRRDFYSSETAEFFERLAPLFYGRGIRCRHQTGDFPQ